MTEISLSNNLIDTDEETKVMNIKKSRGRPINPVRHLPNGKVNNNPLDPEYYKKYYHKRWCTPYTCGICGRNLANEQKIKQHENSAICQKAKKKLENVWV